MPCAKEAGQAYRMIQENEIKIIIIIIIIKYDVQGGYKGKKTQAYNKIGKNGIIKTAEEKEEQAYDCKKMRYEERYAHGIKRIMSKKDIILRKN